MQRQITTEIATCLSPPATGTDTFWMPPPHVHIRNERKVVDKYRLTRIRLQDIQKPPLIPRLPLVILQRSILL